MVSWSRTCTGECSRKALKTDRIRRKPPKTAAGGLTTAVCARDLFVKYAGAERWKNTILLLLGQGLLARKAPSRPRNLAGGSRWSNARSTWAEPASTPAQYRPRA